MTEKDLTEMTEDEPDVIEGDVEVNRWTEYGHDRVYIDLDDTNREAFIDLQDEELVKDYPGDYRMEIENGVAEITKHWGEDNSKVVTRIELWESEGDGDDDSKDEDDDENGDMEECGNCRSLGSVHGRECPYCNGTGKVEETTCPETCHHALCQSKDEMTEHEQDVEQAIRHGW